MNRESLAGTGKVFSFTFGQMAKSKANIISFLVMALIFALAVPIASIAMGGRSSKAAEIETVYIINETDFELDTGDMGESFANTAFTQAGFSAEEAKEELKANEVCAHIYFHEQGEIVISLSILSDEFVNSEEMEALRQALTDRVTEARFLALNASQEQLDIVMSDFVTEVMDAADYSEEETADFGARFAVQYAYSIIVMMVSIFSAAYIIRCVIEEKASKLVDLLMVSVKPLALVFGKILAVMVYIFSMLIGLIVIFAASCLISGMFLDLSPIWNMLSDMGINAEILNISPMTLVVVLVSMLLATLTTAILAGLAGSTCSNMNEVEGANMTVVLVIMAGYLVSSFVPAVGSMGVVASLVPIVSAFSAPAQYITGGIGMPVMLVSWLIQLVVVVLLLRLCARVYHSLILHSGGKVKLSTLISMYKEKPAKEAR